MTTIRRTGTILRGLLALAVLVVLVVGVPVVLVATIGNPIPDQWAWTEPLSATVLLGLLALVAWVLWGQLVVCVLVEAIAEVRAATGRSADWMARMPGTFGGQQALARNLVHAVVAIGVTTTALGSAAPLLDRAHAEAVPTTIDPAPQATDRGTAPMVVAAPKHRVVATVTVERGDTLWSLAEQHLGAGERWREIAAINTGRTMNDGTTFNDSHTIVPGWTLAIPAPVSAAANAVTVQPGDTLWGIAEEQYGDGTKWDRIYQSNRTVIEDPHWIYVGEQLRVPQLRTDTDNEQEPADTTSEGPSHSEEQEPVEPPEQKPPPGLGQSQPNTTDSDADRESTPTSDPSEDLEDDSVAPVVMRAFVGAGAMLACFLLAGYVARRRGQTRRRRSGRVIAATKSDNVAIEAALRTAGPTVADDVDVLEGALRGLVGIPDGVPDVAAVRLGSEQIELVLNQPRMDAPDPWVAGQAGARWTVDKYRLEVDTDGPAPYPALVCIGEDEVGAAWFIDLEAAGLVTLTGDEKACGDVARFIAADLAANRWSDTVHLICASIDAELGHIDPDRIEFVAEADPEVLVKRATRIREIKEANGIDVLEGRSDPNLGDNWTPTVVVAACVLPTPDSEVIADLSDYVAGGRAAIALVGICGQPGSVGMTIEVADDGTADIGWARVRLNRLTSDEAIAIGNAFADLDADDEEASNNEISEHGVNAGIADALGALRRELIDERSEDGGLGSLLPEPDEDYLGAAATTSDDIRVLAPPVRADAVENIDDLDPTLDADIEAWFDPTSPTPKLRVLGPIELQVDGQIPERAKSRVAYLTEVCAYLACHPGGRTAQQMAESFYVRPGTIHKRLEELRLWLGEDPATGGPRVPEAKLSGPGAIRGVGNYVVTGVLHDADLFRRLRIRAQLRGSDGIEDLNTALRLVEGQPFDQQRVGGYGWLVEAGTDHHLAAAVVDVAHIVATDALAANQPERADWAAKIGILASPYEDKPHLDLVAAKQAMGHTAEAEALLRDAVLNRSDEGFAPPDPSQRERDVLSRRSVAMEA